MSEYASVVVVVAVVVVGVVVAAEEEEEEEGYDALNRNVYDRPIERVLAGRASSNVEVCPMRSVLVRGVRATEESEGTEESGEVQDTVMGVSIAVTVPFSGVVCGVVCDG